MPGLGNRYQQPMLSWLLAAVIVLIAACSVDTKDSTPSTTNSVSIPFSRYTLDNGLTVIIHEDHSDPVAHIDVTYHVGSAREELGKSGFAHLFEHMMFQGSENVADEEHFKIVTEAGGTMNGTTNRDRTNYFQTVPVNHLETMLWLEADRMGFFLEGITQEKFEIQRATVKNEKQQNYDNRAYGQAWELLTKTMYPYGHPYSWLTIGDLEDLDKVTAEDLRNFFLRWYGPNNATLTIGGDVNPKEVLPLVEKYFGGIQRGPEVKPTIVDPVVLDDDRYVSYYDSNIRFPAVLINFPTVPKFHPDAAALRCLSEILGNGKGSYLYQNLVANRRAIQASAAHSVSELAGEFYMFVLPFPGKTLTEFEQELRSTLVQFENNGVSDTDLQKFKARYESNYVNGLEKVSGKITKLAYYETFAGDAAYYSDELEKHLSVTKDDVMRVYKKYIKNKPSVVLSILASPDEAPAQADNFQIPTSGENTFPTADYTGLTYNKAEDNFDRSIKPAAKAARLVTPPAHWKRTSKNDIQIIGAQTEEIPKVVMQLSIKGGYSQDMQDLSKLGLSQLTASLMNTSTENYTEKEIAEELEKIGSSIYVGSSAQSFSITLSALRKNLDRTIELLEEKLLRPAFTEEDFLRLQNQQIESAKSSTKEASSIAPMVYNRLIYGDQHIFGIPDTQLINTLPHLTADDAREFYANHFSPDKARLVVVGNIDADEVMRKMDFLWNWQGEAIDTITFPSSPSYEKAGIFFVNKPGAAQSEIRVGYLTDLEYDATGEYFKRYLMNFPLGGAFNSRINLNLREEKGLTYGARSWFEGSEIAGPFTVSTSVKASGTAIAVEEIIKEITLMAEEGITPEEIDFLRQAVGQRDALKYESSQQKAEFLGRMQRFGISDDYVEKQKHVLNTIDKESIDMLARKHLPLEKMVIAVVGDADIVFEDLEALGYPVTLLSEEGIPLNAE